MIDRPPNSAIPALTTSDLAITFHARSATPSVESIEEGRKKRGVGKNEIVLAAPLASGGGLSSQAARLDRALGGAAKAGAQARNLKGAAGEVLEIFAPAGSDFARLYLYGVTPPQNLSEKHGKAKEGEKTFPKNPPPVAVPLTRVLAAEAAGAALFARLSAAHVDSAWVYCANDETALALAQGALLRSWQFDPYHTRAKTKNKPRLSALHLIASGGARLNRDFESRRAVAEGVFFARALVSEPPNRLYPESFVAAARQRLTPLGVSVSALGEAAMERLGMGALLGVGQGSERPSRLLIMEYKGGRKGAAPVALVGKGVCFDTGGISLKPAGGMEDMKYDMGGAGAVAGALAALAGRKAKANVVGVAGLVENMPDGKAQRPSDIVRTASGQTVEVLNTDAEGRLVLADALWYAQTKFKPAAIVDLATLTGAMVVSLGDFAAGCFSNDKSFGRALQAAGESVSERLWPFPLSAHYDASLTSKAADMQNISSDFGAGSITAAQFLQRFVEGETPWAHLDIAGVAWSKKGAAHAAAAGATGFGVRLLDAYVRRYVERRRG